MSSGIPLGLDFRGQSPSSLQRAFEDGENLAWGRRLEKANQLRFGFESCEEQLKENDAFSVMAAEGVPGVC